MQVEYKRYVMPWVIVSLTLGPEFHKTVALCPKKIIITLRRQPKIYGPVRTLLCCPVAVVVAIICVIGERECVCVCAYRNIYLI